jgi:hypothetical protein
MSSLGVHTVQSIAAGAVLYPFIGENVVPFGLAAIFIDLDHVVEYIRQTRSLDVRGVFACCKLIENNLHKKFLVFNMFHTVEFHCLIVCLAMFFPVFNYVLAGCLFHMACDMVHLLRNDHFFVRAYSLFEYMYRSRTGRYVLSVRSLVEKHKPDISGISGICSWLRKWGWKQDGVIDANPYFFAGEGNRTEK